jgi:hypothetical protein
MPSNFDMQPPLPSLTKGFSSMNYSSKKARKQNWLNQYKKNKKLETEKLLKGF